MQIYKFYRFINNQILIDLSKKMIRESIKLLNETNFQSLHHQKAIPVFDNVYLLIRLNTPYNHCKY